jgi:hypothetical protein
MFVKASFSRSERPAKADEHLRSEGSQTSREGALMRPKQPRTFSFAKFKVDAIRDPVFRVAELIDVAHPKCVVRNTWGRLPPRAPRALPIGSEGATAPRCCSEVAVVRKSIGGSSLPRHPPSHFDVRSFAMEETSYIDLEQLLHARRQQEEYGGWLKYDGSTLPVFGALTSLELPMESFLVAPGVTLAQTYVDIFSPPMMAFAPPPDENAHHPAPWVSIVGGLPFASRTELSLTSDGLPTSLTIHATVWLLAALLRLRLEAPIQLAVLANMPFSLMVNDPGSVDASTFESGRLIGHFRRNPARITPEDSRWLQKHYPKLVELYSDRYGLFFRSFGLYEEAAWLRSFEQSTLLIWTALETLFDIGFEPAKAKATARAISDFLMPKKSDSDRMYPAIRFLYQERNSIAHTAGNVAKNFDTLVWIARNVFIKVIEQGLPV